MNDQDLKIINLICDLKANKEIATLLNLSLPTLNLKIRNIFKALNVSTRYELIYLVKTKGVSHANRNTNNL